MDSLSPQIIAGLVLAFGLTATIYSSAGFAGGSTYLALLALTGIPLGLMPTTALVCNIIVSLGGSVAFYRAGHFQSRTTLPFLITSIPCAYLGGLMPIGRTAFLILLGVSLLIASMRLFINRSHFEMVRGVSQKTAWTAGPIIGSGLGFWAGITGIGGGIFLAPVLYFLGWAKPKTIAASASFFILVNSLSGLVGQLQKNSFKIDTTVLLPLAIAVFVGGQIGSRIGAGVFNAVIIRRVTAFLIFFVAINIFWNLYGGSQ